MTRSLASTFAGIALLFATVAQAYADTQGSQPAASGDKTWLGIVVVVLLVASLAIIRPRPRR
jgi:ABC-type sulfate transport system permease component